MHSFSPYLGGRDDDRLQFGAHMSQPVYPGFNGMWLPADPTLYNAHFEQQQQPQQQQHQKQQQKHISPDYFYFQQPQPMYNNSSPRTSEPMTFTGHSSGWTPQLDSYRHLRYNSPGGHLGGTLSESSSDHTFSPDITRQQIALSPDRYLSPQADSLYTQHSWATDNSFFFTPAPTPSNSQTHLIALRELEFQGTPDYQLETQDDQAGAQLHINVPEELELSDSLATLTTTSRTDTAFSAQSHDDSDSSVSTPARENDSDSDFDPRKRLPRSDNGARNLVARPLRRIAASSHSTIDTKHRVHKAVIPRAASSKERSTPRALSALSAATNASSNDKLPKSFPCSFHAFGCPATFANKNEWKRHVTSQHLQLGFYRCDLGTCNPDNASQQHTHHVHGRNQSSKGRGHNKRRPTSLSHAYNEAAEVKVFNDFNRKDLFTQHCRRMHGPLRHLLDSTTRTNQSINMRIRVQARKPPGSSGRVMSTKDDENAFEEELDEIRARCWTVQRHAPERSSCGFCRKSFEASSHSAVNDTDGRAGERAWEERMEHVGRHYERDGCSPSLEGIDQDLLDWGLREGILVDIDGVGAWLAGYDTATVEPGEEANQREGLRRRGPRRRIAVPRAESDTNMYRPLSSVVKEEDSDEDALAEDD